MLGLVIAKSFIVNKALIKFNKNHLLIYCDVERFDFGPISITGYDSSKGPKFNLECAPNNFECHLEAGISIGTVVNCQAKIDINKELFDAQIHLNIFSYHLYAHLQLIKK